MIRGTLERFDTGVKEPLYTSFPISSRSKQSLGFTEVKQLLLESSDHRTHPTVTPLRSADVPRKVTDRVWVAPL